MKLVNSPAFCFISPISYLDIVEETSNVYGESIPNVHLVLAHLVESDTKYAEFYASRALAGDTIIMDNSAYELKVPYSPEQLASLGQRCGASVIVLPDYPFEHPDKTIEAAEQLIPIFKDNGFKTFFVPQSTTGDLEAWISAYTWASENDGVDVIGMSILGIPNALPHILPAYARVVMTQLLIDRDIFNHEKHHHYLGLNAGPALEIPSLIDMDALDTIDSSNPIWMAILGHRYTVDADSYLSVSKSTVPVDFHISRSKDPQTIARIRSNISTTQDLMLHHNANRRAWYAEE